MSVIPHGTDGINQCAEQCLLPLYCRYCWLADTDTIEGTITLLLCDECDVFVRAKRNTAGAVKMPRILVL